MRSQEGDELNSSLSVLSQERVITCSQNRLAHTACSNRNCDVYAFTCSDNHCRCRKEHQFCFMTEIKTIEKNFASKLYSTEPLIKLVNDQFTKLIDKVLLFKDKILQDISTSFELYGLKNEEQRLYKTLKNLDNVYQITGLDIWQSCFNQTPQRIPNFDRLISKINKSFFKCDKIIDENLLEIEMNVLDYSQGQMSKVNKKQECEKIDGNLSFQSMSIRRQRKLDEDESADQRDLLKSILEYDFSHLEDSSRTEPRIRQIRPKNESEKIKIQKHDSSKRKN